jgi:hypothetical protein
MKLPFWRLMGYDRKNPQEKRNPSIRDGSVEKRNDPGCSVPLSRDIVSGKSSIIYKVIPPLN